MNVTLLQLGASYMNKHGEITQFPLLCWVWLDRKRYTSQCSQAKLEESNNQRAEARGFLFPMYTSLGWLYHLVAAPRPCHTHAGMHIFNRFWMGICGHNDAELLMEDSKCRGNCAFCKLDCSVCYLIGFAS
jgi:hypothetical protein